MTALFSRRALPDFTPQANVGAGPYSALPLSDRIATLPAVLPSSAHALSMNELVALAHLRRLKDRVRYLLRGVKVRVLQRIRFDGKSLPPELQGRGGPCSDWWWHESHLHGNNRERGAIPPLGVRRWCYREVEQPASQAVKIQWDITLEEIVRLFHYWRHKSILSVDDYSACIDEGRGQRSKQAGSEGSGLILIAWDLLEDVASGADLFRPHKLQYTQDNYSIIPITYDASDVVPVTEHESLVLARRPHLCRVLRNAIGDTWTAYADAVYEVWHAAQRRAERQQWEERDEYAHEEPADEDVSVISDGDANPTDRQANDSRTWVTEDEADEDMA